MFYLPVNARWAKTQSDTMTINIINGGVRHKSFPRRGSVLPNATQRDERDQFHTMFLPPLRLTRRNSELPQKLQQNIHLLSFEHCDSRFNVIQGFKQVLIYFRLGERYNCFTVKLQKGFVYEETSLQHFRHWVDNDWLFILGWTITLKWRQFNFQWFYQQP